VEGVILQGGLGKVHVVVVVDVAASSASTVNMMAGRSIGPLSSHCGGRRRESAAAIVVVVPQSSTSTHDDLLSSSFVPQLS